jgi:hypothetical protein
VDDVERLVRRAQEARAAAEEALAKVREALADGKGGEAKSRAIAYGICVEKAGLLAQQAQQAREHEIRVTEEQANIVVRAIRGLWTDLGLAECFRPGGEAGAPPPASWGWARPRSWPGGARGGGPRRAAHRGARAELLAEGLIVEARPKPPPAEDEAHGLPAPQHMSREAESQLQAHAPQLDKGDGQRAPPAPNDDHDARDSPRAEEMMGASRVIRTPPERRQARSQSRTNGSTDVEVVDGEVVDKPEGWGAVEAAGRKLPDGRVRPLPDQGQGERAKADEERQRERERQPQTSPPDDLYGDPSRWHYP